MLENKNPGSLLAIRDLSFSTLLRELKFSHDLKQIFGLSHTQIDHITHKNDVCFIVCTTSKKLEQGFYYIITPDTMGWIETCVRGDVQHYTI